MTDRQDEWERQQRLQRLLQQQGDEVPTDVGARLAEMRRQAVQEMTEPATGSHWSVTGWLLGGSGLAAATVVVGLTVAVTLTSSDPLEMPLTSEPEVAVLEDLEVLEELEFLAWLEEEESGAG